MTDLSQYLPILLFLVVALALSSAFVFLPMGVSRLTGTHKPTEAKLTEYECGFPAFEDSRSQFDVRFYLVAILFLLFDLEDNNSTVLKRFENPTAGTYLKELGKHLKSRTEQVENDWKSGYRMAFIQNNGTDAGSAVSMLYNDFVKSYEGLKNFKVGLPLGKRPGQTAIEPNLAEAYYSGKSITFLKEHFRSMEDIWHGKSQAGVDGPGFKEYLESVEGGKALVDLTLPQLEKIKSDLNSLPPNPRFSQQLTTNFQQIDQLHTDLQKHTRFFKSDMSSVLGIAITYSSGDGD